MSIANVKRLAARHLGSVRAFRAWVDKQTLDGIDELKAAIDALVDHSPEGPWVPEEEFARVTGKLAEAQARERLRANLIRRLVRLLGGCPDHPDGCGSHRYAVVRIMEEAQAELANPVAIEPTDLEKRLAESQAREAALRKALSAVAEVEQRTVRDERVWTIHDGDSYADLMNTQTAQRVWNAAVDALALPVDSSALDAAQLEAVREFAAGVEDGLLERFASDVKIHDNIGMALAKRDERLLATERAKTAAAEVALAELKSWPCETESCHVTVGSADTQHHANGDGTGLFYCGRCWRKAANQQHAERAAAEANATHLDGLHTNACVRMGELAAEAGAAEAREMALRKALTRLLDDWERTSAGFAQHVEVRYACRDGARAALAAPLDNTALRVLMVKAATAQREADHTFASDGPETRPEANSSAPPAAEGEETMKLDLEDCAIAVMNDYDEETTGNQALDNLINAAMAHKADLATARAEAREEALEDAAKVCDESIRILASRPVAVFDNYREYLKALVKRPAAPTCARCGGNGIDPEHIGVCGECGGRAA